MYRTLTGGVVPRPIAWVSSQSTTGEMNLAPYSFFNVVSVDPPILMFAPQRRPDGLSDTARNVIETGEFVVNVVTEELVEEMNQSSSALPPEQNEFEFAHVGHTESRKVTPPRVTDAKVAFECSLHRASEVGGATLILGEVIHVHVLDDVISGGKLDVSKLDAVGRLAGGYYSRTTDRFMLDRPDD